MIIGLGAATLTASQIYQTAIGAGFPPDVATQMTAIALRESGGNPNATAIISNPAPGNLPEQSFGLWQINVLGNPGIMSQLGITDPSQLLDPATNAKAAYLLWGGNPANLNTAWYINRPGYQQAYEQYLPVAEAAASGYNSDSSLPDSSAAGFSTDSIDLTDPGTLILAVAATLGALYLATR